MKQLLLRILLIGAGGAVGSVLRYLISGWVKGLTSIRFPVGTMVVNITGCLVIGFLAAIFYSDRSTASPELRDAILIGVLGGYTTFSSFAWETLGLANESEFLAATANVVVSVVVGLAAAWIGVRVARVAFGV